MSWLQAARESVVALVSRSCGGLWHSDTAEALAHTGRPLTVLDVKSKLKRKLLKLKVQQKQDQEALRYSEKHLMQAKNVFLKGACPPHNLPPPTALGWVR